MGVLVTDLKSRRKAAGLTARDLAAYLGVSTPVLYTWEKGAAPIPDTHLQRLARIFGIDVGQLRQEDQLTRAAFKRQAIARVTALVAKSDG